jgi:hypothetical protein
MKYRPLKMLEGRSSVQKLPKQVTGQQTSGEKLVFSLLTFIALSRQVCVGRQGWPVYLRKYPLQGGLFSPCNMNLSASQHAKTPQKRKRVFVKVQFPNEDVFGKTKGRITHPRKLSGALRWRLSQPACTLCKRFECHPVILHLNLKRL